MSLRHRFPALSVTVLALLAAGMAFTGATQTHGALARDSEGSAGFALAAQTTPQPGGEASATPTWTPTPDTTPTQTPIPTSTPNLTGEMEPCTFTAARAINLRAGPGTGFRITAVLGGGESIDVIGQKTGADGFVWWDVGDAWVRSDLGENDCASLCGNTVCESGENSAACPQDCWAPAPTPTRASASTGASETADTSSACYVSNCQSCYETISCYPECSECTCSQNSSGCSTCYCRYPASSQSQSTSGASTTSGTTAESRTCDFASCAECIAAFPCTPGPCGTTQCTLNEFGCPECTTAP